ncbi:MAG: 3-hydroxyacyl-CoA dehydrogenase/enoyl-CoA hydratase/3-hydroxybutyryl-CoA epimerase [Planctomycetota bacterium]|jgi:3-hydroxyacyl-CoA dehydrogenase/enoyl-CoA hydratase/3-hydroxybutyryl-CoA epimerase
MSTELENSEPTDSSGPKAAEHQLPALHMPEDAPGPGTCIRIEHPESGLAVLILDPPHRKMAVLDMALMRDLDSALNDIERDESLRGLVITGREPLNFAVGADVKAIESVTDNAQALALIRFGQLTFERIAKLSKHSGGRVFTVAAVGGPVPGGAFELSLACDRILLADDPRTRIGLPEVKLGIFPGWGGTVRLPRRIGVPRSLSVILTGRLFKARAALKLGMVDRLTHPEYLRRIAADIALGRMKCRTTRRGIWRYLIDRNPLALNIIKSQAEKGVRKQTRGHYPAPLAALDMVVKTLGMSVDEGLSEEAARVTPLITHSITKSLVGLFGRTEEAKKLALLPSGDKAAKIERAGVIGAGVMGGGIASLLADKGFDTRLRDLDQAALDASVYEHRVHIEKQKQRRRKQKHEATAAIDRLEFTTEPLGFGRCDIVIEAVAEKLPIKQAVLGELAKSVAPDAILATNTSSLSVTAIAEGLPNPERVVGMHFFNPVRKMPLVEIVRGEATSDEVVARTARLALDIGKTPVVVKDVAGFLVNRLLGPYLDEALRLFENGADPAVVDKALLEFGMPMGPFELLDEVGLDIASHAADSLSAAYGERMTKSDSLAALITANELGKKSGRGVYLWTKGKRGRLTKGARNPRFARHPGSKRSDATLPSHEIVDRCVLAMVTEAARCLDEQVVATPGELDLATVFGMGFAPFRGGLWRYAEARGTDVIRKRLAELSGSAGVADRVGGAERFRAVGPLE